MAGKKLLNCALIETEWLPASLLVNVKEEH